MKHIRFPTALVSATLCATLATGNTFAETNYMFGSQSVDHEPRVTLYFQKGFGNKKHRLAAPAFGLSLERQGSFSIAPTYATSFMDNNAHSALPPSMRLLDLRFSSLSARGVRINGMNIDSSGSYDNESYDDSYGDGSYGSYSEESWKNPWLWIGIALGGTTLAACLTHNVICKKDENNNSSSGGMGY